MKEISFIATESYLRFLTKDKIYKSKNGKITYDDGYIGCSYDNYKDYCSQNPLYASITREIVRKGNINNFE